MLAVCLISSMGYFKNEPPSVCIKVNKATHHGSETYIIIIGVGQDTGLQIEDGEGGIERKGMEKGGEIRRGGKARKGK